MKIKQVVISEEGKSGSLLRICGTLCSLHKGRLSLPTTSRWFHSGEGNIKSISDFARALSHYVVNRFAVAQDG